MTLEQVIARALELDEEIRELTALDELDEDQEARFDALDTEALELAEKRAKIEKREATAKRVAQLARDPHKVEGEPATEGFDDPFGADGIRNAPSIKNPWDLDELRGASPADTKARAFSAVERAQGFKDKDREILTRWIEDLDVEADSESSRRMARHIVATSAPEYLRSWIRAFKTGAKHSSPDPESVQFLNRAMSLTTTEGGFAIPQQLDPALILTSDGSTNPIRQIARHVIATGNVWTGLSTTHASWSNDAAATEVSDDATTFAQPSITVHKPQVFIPFGVEIEMDYPGFTEDLRMIIANGKDDLDATNFVTGSGTNQPIGIVTALTGGASEVPSVTTDVFALEDVYALETALPQKYLSRAQWTANRAIYNDIRQFDTAGGAGLWERVGNGLPPELLSYPAHVASAFDGSVTALAENYVAVLGDWSNYVVVDRLGMTLELVPHLFATATNYPNGTRGFYGYARTGADSVNDGGFRMLNVT